MHSHQVHIKANGINLTASCCVFDAMKGIIIFALAGSNKRHDSRLQMAASYLQKQGFGTMLLDLLSLEEDFDENRRNIDLLSQRLIATSKWYHHQPEANGADIMILGTETGSAAALMAAAQWPKFSAVVCLGGCPELAIPYTSEIASPTLLIAASNDASGIRNIQQVFTRLTCIKQQIILENASANFSEPGTLLQACQQTANWFQLYRSASTLQN